MFYCRYQSPLGILVLAEAEGKLRYCWWEDVMERMIGDEWMEVDSSEDSLLAEACRQLNDYFSGKRSSFDLPLGFDGTPFQRLAWQNLLTIPYGATFSYTEQARRMGREKAVRAVGNANGHNPLMLFVPCHRVIASNGTLGGYAGGTDRKRQLLSIEKEDVSD